MKVGDFLICKENYGGQGTHNQYQWVFYQNKAYEITGLGGTNIHIENRFFNLYLKNQLYIWKYFYTESELRKLKIQKLNEYRIGK